MTDPTTTAAESGSNPDGKEIVDEGAMISAMRRYRAAKAEQEQRRERANRYLRQIRSEIEADLAAGDEYLGAPPLLDAHLHHRPQQRKEIQRSRARHRDHDHPPPRLRLQMRNSS